jgi:hypothetical protein
MEKIKILSLRREMVFQGTKFALLLAAAIAAPLIGQQAITGTIVNAILFISVIYIGIRGAVLIALVPSIFSLATGLLPIVLWPMIPFIMVSNIILILTFNFLRKSAQGGSAAGGKNFLVSIFSAGVLKFAFLAGVSSILINLFLKKEIAHQAVLMMSWPQLATAMAGGILAYFASLIFAKKNAA